MRLTQILMLGLGSLGLGYVVTSLRWVLIKQREEAKFWEDLR